MKLHAAWSATVLLALAARAPAQTVLVERPALPAGMAERFLAQTEERPYFRAFLQLDSLLGQPTKPDLSSKELDTALLVHKRLGSEGLLPTTARAMAALELASLAPDQVAARLARVGIPVDLCERVAPGILSELHTRLAPQAGTSATEALDLLCKELAFRALPWTPTIAGFELAEETGELSLSRVRVQLPRPDDWQAEGDGGAVDLVRSLAAAMPELDFVVHAQADHVDALAQLFQSWPSARRERYLIFPQTRAVSQWAQDAAKYGFAQGEGGRTGWLLAPRYASRGEELGTLAPGDELATQTFHAAGAQLARSPLLFQGGNVLCARDPKTGVRWLLVGEAELHRNMALGLSREAALAALRGEFGCQRTLVLPATSFHIDMDLSLRVHEGQLVAFVPDTGAASRAVLECGFPGLVAGGALTAAEVEEVRGFLASNRTPEAISKLSEGLARVAVGPGQFPLALAKHFESGPGDSGVGNLQRVLLAVDLLVAETLADPQAAGIDAATSVYLQSLRKREVERIQVAQALAKEGFRVVGVPSLSAGRRSLCTINGLHAPGVYLMPANGGFLAAFDQTAQRVWEAALPGVKVLPIRCAETQRRSGALHCAVLALPKP